MRIHVIYDKNGAIVGGGASVSLPRNLRGPRSAPEDGGGHSIGEFEVPAEHSDLSLHDLVERIRVDVRSKEHRLVAK